MQDGGTRQLLTLQQMFGTARDLELSPPSSIVLPKPIFVSYCEGK